MRSYNLVLVLLSVFSAGLTRGEVTWLGPTPYRSVADSPFNLSGLGSTFFLDDFESGIFRYPNLIVVDPARIRGPSPLTDSVDADDGQIDGSGSGGRSLVVSGGLSTFPTVPPTHESLLRIAVSIDSGYNALGFVWTDALPRHDLYLNVIHSDLHSESHYMDFGQSFMSDTYSGETAEDRFIGFVSDGPIVLIEIATRSQGFGPPSERFEIDHLQFGVQTIPEPDAVVLLTPLIVSLAMRCRITFHEWRREFQDDVCCKV